MSYPVTFEADYVEGRSRLTAFFRLLLAIPLAIVLYVYAIVACVAVVIAWFAIVITGHFPKGLYDFLAGFTRFQVRFTAYAALLCDPYPSFSGSDDPGYPVRLQFAGPLEHYTRWKTLLRMIIAIPVGLIALRVRRHTFVVITIAIFFVFQLSAINFSFTGGTAGLQLPLIPWLETNYNKPFYYAALAALVFAVLLSITVRRSRFGLQLLAIRDDEDRAAGLGVKVFAVKLVGFTMSAFVVGMGGAIYAIFIGAAVATRRNDHLYLTAVSEALHGTPRLIVEIVIRFVVLGVAFCLIWFGYINFLRGFGSFRLPSGTPIASLYAIIPLSGVLIALFTIEQLVNGIRNGFDHPQPFDDDLPTPPLDASARTRVGL